MARRHRKASRPGRRAEPSRELGDPAASVAAAAIALAFVAIGLLIDSGADAAFDAPKRLATLFLIGAAAAALSFSPGRLPMPGWKPRSPRDGAVLALVAALAWAIFSMLASPRRASSFDALRVLLLYALLLPIGASRVLRRSGRLLLGVFLCVAAVNAGVSVLQARGIFQPFALVTEFGSRESTGAYVGNVGYLALGLALAAVGALAILLGAAGRFLRGAAAAAALLFGAGLLVNQNLTSLSALLVGGIVLAVPRFGRRALLPGLALVVALAAGIALYRPMRERVAGVLLAARQRDWNRVVTYRVGAWKAAAAMAAERPLTGYGPGTFEAEYIPHRLQAEIAARTRYDNPERTSSYAEAHCDYLQVLAETGWPGGIFAVTAAGLLLFELARTIRRLEGRTRAEAVFLLAFLSAGAAAALTWFPLQRPISAVALLLAAGRGWALLPSPESPEEAA
ncbi:MAG TPA: O-antigen ligase family protein [Thermoanaerobaculia bacterium]|nr:O-antigen ligase family protein [Thermoanaerobaculia bacterium]